MERLCSGLFCFFTACTEDSIDLREPLHPCFPPFPEGAQFCLHNIV